MLKETAKIIYNDELNHIFIMLFFILLLLIVFIWTDSGSDLKVP